MYKWFISTLIYFRKILPLTVLVFSPTLPLFFFQSKRERERFTDFICDDVLSFISVGKCKRSVAQTPLTKWPSHFKSMVHLFRALGFCYKLQCANARMYERRGLRRLEDTKYNDKIQKPTSEVEQTTAGIRCERDVMDPMSLTVCEGEKLGFEVTS